MAIFTPSRPAVQLEELKAPNGTVPVGPKRITLEEYWAVYYHDLDHTYEYNNGLLEEKPVAKKIHADLFSWFVSLLRQYLAVRPIADLSMLEIGFTMRLPNKTQVRRPDLGIVRHDNPIPFEDHDHNYQGIFDVCVEMVSDSSKREIRRDTEIKYDEYETAGVKEYWLLSYDPDILGFYRLNAQGIYQPVQPTADGVWVSAELPGFQVRVTDLLNTPNLNELTDDPVYSGFVFPKYQQMRLQVEQERLQTAQERLRVEIAEGQIVQTRIRAEIAEQQVGNERRRTAQAREQVEQERERVEQERQRAEQERQRAEQERQRAEQERQRAEKLAELLRQQGIDPDTVL